MALDETRGTDVRRRIVAAAAIVVLHLMIGIWLAQDRPVRVQTSSPIIDVDLSPGFGSGPGPIRLDTAKERDTADASSPVSEPTSQISETSAPTTTTDPLPALEPAATTPPEAIDSMPSPMSAPAAADEVLKQVEALIGTTASDLAVDPVQVERAMSEGWTASQPGGGGGCALNETIRAQLMADQAASGELAAYPVAQRSVANAIQLWNGEWLTGEEGHTAPRLPEVRRVISTTVSEASDDCQKALLQGPHFVFVTPNGASPIILVIGSGEWQWAELADAEAPGFFRWFGLRPEKD